MVKKKLPKSLAKIEDFGEFFLGQDPRKHKDFEFFGGKKKKSRKKK